MIDVVLQINAAARRVGSRTLEAGEARVVSIGRTYDSSVDDVWDACTNPDRIPRWFLPVTGDLRVGGRFQLEGNAGGTIERCDPPQGFAATWEFGGAVSWIELRLSPEPDGRTRLELDHTVPVDAHWEEFGPGAVGVGWDLAMADLGLHLASGEPLDRDAVAAWSSSGEGLGFMRESSERWGEAHRASGADRAEAEAMTARTTAAYTGGESESA
ncbi:MAG: SRPBCC family protein [Acidimicrobiales bacterium]